MLVLIVVLATFVSGCGSDDTDVAADPAETEDSSAETTELQTYEREWGAEYEQVVTDAFEAARRAQQRDNCRQARLSTNDELIELFVSSAGGGSSNFEQMMSRLGLTPDDEDFNYAAGLAVGVIRERCAEEFPNLAVDEDGPSVDAEVGDE